MYIHNRLDWLLKNSVGQNWADLCTSKESAKVLIIIETLKDPGQTYLTIYGECPYNLFERCPRKYLVFSVYRLRGLC